MNEFHRVRQLVISLDCVPAAFFYDAETYTLHLNMGVLLDECEAEILNCGRIGLDPLRSAILAGAYAGFCKDNPDKPVWGLRFGQWDEETGRSK